MNEHNHTISCLCGLPVFVSWPPNDPQPQLRHLTPACHDFSVSSDTLWEHVHQQLRHVEASNGFRWVRVRVSAGSSNGAYELVPGITSTPDVCGGAPCIAGHRIEASVVLDELAAGASTTELLNTFPGLTEHDVTACIAYGAWAARQIEGAQP